MRKNIVLQPLNMGMLNQWRKERDKVVKTYDVEAFKKFYIKWTKRGLYDMKLPADEVIEISMRKMVYHMASATPEQKAEAEAWLIEHGSSKEL